MTIEVNGDAVCVTNDATEGELIQVLRRMWVNKEPMPKYLRGSRDALAIVFSWGGIATKWNNTSLEGAEPYDALKSKCYISDFCALNLQESDAA